MPADSGSTPPVRAADASAATAAGQGSGKPARPPVVLPADRTQAATPDLARGLIDDAQRLVELQIQLARAELRALAIRNGVAVALLLLAATFLIFAIFAAIPVMVIELVSNHVLAAIIWVVGYVILAIILGIIGRFTLKLQPPERTIAALKETKEWLVQQISISR